MKHIVLKIGIVISFILKCEASPSESYLYDADNYDLVIECKLTSTSLVSLVRNDVYIPRNAKLALDGTANDLATYEIKMDILKVSKVIKGMAKKGATVPTFYRVYSDEVVQKYEARKEIDRILHINYIGVANKNQLITVFIKYESGFFQNSFRRSKIFIMPTDDLDRKRKSKVQATNKK